MNSGATHRPTLPMGTEAMDGLGITRPLWISGEVELYLLEHRGSEDWVLVHMRSPLPGEQWAALQAWWREQEAAGLHLEALVPPERSPTGGQLAVLRLAGDHATDAEQVSATGPEARELAGALLAAAEAGLAAGLVANLRPQAVWFTTTGGQRSILAPLPLLPLPEDERPILHDIGAVLYRAMAGIHLGPHASGRPPTLVGWLEEADRTLATLAEQCVGAGASTGGAITTLGELRRALGLPLAPKEQRASPSLADVRAANCGRDGPAAKKGLAAVAGMHALKSLLREEVIAPLREPERFRRYGLTVPNGILLYGPPGCGKTYIARRLAEELEFHFFEIVPSEISSSFIHGTVLKIREVFDRAAEHAPALVFIDEFEAMAPKRSGLDGHQQYKSEEVNELLVQMSGSADRRIVLIVATNDPGSVDPAILRTGRLDKHIEVGLPDGAARREMLELHLAGRPLSNELAFDRVAAALEGRSASDIKFLVDEAARRALAADTALRTGHLLEAITENPLRVPEARPDNDFTGFRPEGMR